MKGKNDVRLDEAIRAVREEEVDLRAAEAARGRVWQRLVSESSASRVDAIRGCHDVRALLSAHAEGTLPAGRSLLVEDHLRECAACRGSLKGTLETMRPWQASLSAPAGRPLTWRHAAAAGLALALGTTAYVQRDFLSGVPSGPRAEVESITGTLYRVAGGVATPLRAGETIAEGEAVRTGRGAQAFLKLRDGSMLEMGEHAEVAVSARRRDTTVHLERGRVIVEAEKRRTGHLYVASADCTVAVTGTTFSVNRGLRGSRVAVVEGEVRVRQAAGEYVLRPGQQHSTSRSLAHVAIHDEIAWSRNADRHLKFLAELSGLRRDLERLPSPGVRYESRLLGGVPAEAAVYIGAPNIGESLSQAHQMFEERLNDSEVLREWWRRAGPRGTKLGDVVARLRRLGEHVGEEIVIAFVPRAAERGGEPNVLLLAEPRSGGLRHFVEKELFAGTGRPPRIVFVTNPAAMPAVTADLYVVLREDVLAVSTDLSTLRAAVLAFDGKAAGLDDTVFGRRIVEAYRDGTGVLLAADAARLRGRHEAPEATGLGDVRYLVAERTEAGGRAVSSAEIRFKSARRGIPSWLAAPGPMGSLEFVSPEAAVAASFVTKNPALVFDDIVSFNRNREDALREMAELEAHLNVRLRDDFAAAFGSDFTLAVDGPLLPVPAFKLVAEVYDPLRLEQAFEALAEAAKRDAGAKGPSIELRHEHVAGRAYHALRIGSRGAAAPFEIYYTFSDGYLVAAPTRALVAKALATRESGRSLARSSRLAALWPTDGHAHVSAMLYQNFASVAPMMQELAAASPERGQAVAALAAQMKTSLVYAYGEEDRIQVAGDLFNFDPGALALPALLQEALPEVARGRRRESIRQ